MSPVYSYTSEIGDLLYQVCRHKNEKKFTQRRPGETSEEWIYNLDGVERVPYRFGEFLADGIEYFFVVEGEKDADRLASNGLHVTTSAGGAGWVWPDEWATYFMGIPTVVVIADNDEPGRKAAHQRAQVIAKVCKDVRLLNLPVDEKGDVSDYLDFHSVDDLWKLVETEYESISPEVVNEKAFTPTPLDLTSTIDPPQELVPGLYAGLGTTLQSDPGVGKSWVALWWCKQLVEDGFPVLYFDEEGGQKLVHRRLNLLGADPKAVRENFYYFPFESRQWDEQDMIELDALCDRTDPVLAVFDSLGDFLAAAGLSENDSESIYAFQKVKMIFRLRDIATLTLDHVTKPSGDGTNSRYARGSGAKLAKDDLSVRLQVATFFDAANDGALFMWKTKDRHGGSSLPYMGADPIRIDVKNNPYGGVTIMSGQQTDKDWIEMGKKHILFTLGAVPRATRGGIKSSAPKGIPPHLLDAAMEQLIEESQITKLPKELFCLTPKGSFHDDF